MKYTVKWLEENLGVTRKALRNYEDKGLIDKATIQNPDNKYRQYSEEDIERIWGYRVLQSVGYSLNEIADMIQNEDFDFQNSINEKIEELERKKTEIEQYIGFAKTLKLTGTFPLPKEMGSIRFEDFIKSAWEYWNVDSDPQMEKLQSLFDVIQNKPESEWTENDFKLIETMLSELDVDLFELLLIDEYYAKLLELKELEVSDTRVQREVDLIYNYYCEHILPEDIAENMTPQKFSRNIVLSFTTGDLSAINKSKYGKENCEFITEALAYFGGYPSASEIY